MDKASFTKITGDALRDEEDERSEVVAKAERLYKAAQDAYYSQGAKSEHLRGFAAAEAAFAPVLSAGLMGLREKELEMVLKGRLHQAVIIAHLQEGGEPECWLRVKALVEDVLQFDFQNCHARWLRGLALLHGQQRHAEAREELQRAVDYARATGKSGEVKQWEDQLQSLFANGEHALLEPKAGHVESAVASEDASTPSDPSTEGGARQTKQESPALQKGFFNRSGGKVSTKKVAKLPAEATKPLEAKAVPTAAEPAASNGPSLEAHLQRQRELEVREHELLQQVAALQEDLQKERKQFQLQVSQKDVDMKGAIEGLENEFASLFEQSSNDDAVEAQSKLLINKMQTSIGKLKDHMQADKVWSEGGQQKYVDFSTEVLTLRDMSVREWKDQHSTAKRHVTELQELTQKLADFKGLAKAVRERVRALQHTADTTEGLDEQRFANCAANFQSLPLQVKLHAFLHDGSILWLLAFVMLLGMIAMVAVVVEVFGTGRCRMACAAR
mmetsp:Transcript_9937/g.22591  ORF Transcript_9937/g.22591 Transcript_9937/m.22591 type:complete len:501 (+) Transcript_9937:61-1563(+)